MIPAVSSAKATPASIATASAAAGGAATRSSVLPVPAAVAGDPLSMMYLFESEDQQLGLRQATTKVQTDQKTIQAAFDREQDALEKAEEAAKHKSFWDKLGDVVGEVAKVAGVVAAVAAAIGSGGAALPVAGAVLSIAGFADGETHVLQKLGMSAGLASVVDTALSLGGAGMAVGAAVAGSTASANATAASVAKGAAVVSALGHVGHGATSIAAGESQKAADEADADAAQAQGEQATIRRLIERVIQDAQNADQQDQQLLQTIAGVKATRSETMTIAATGMRG